MGVPMLGSSQLHQPSAPCSTDPPHSGPTSNSPPADHPTDVPPTTVAPVDDLLLPFDHSDTALPLVPPNVSSGKSYPKQKPGQNMLQFQFSCLLTLLLGSKVFKFIQEPQKRMKTYSRLTRKIEKLVCTTQPPFVATCSYTTNRPDNFTSKPMHMGWCCLQVLILSHSLDPSYFLPTTWVMSLKARASLNVVGRK